jgi:hypothetical protein
MSDLDQFFVSLLKGDRPLTLGFLIYIVYLLHKSDKKQNKAIKWLRGTLANLLIRVENLEQFNKRKFPNEYRKPESFCDIPPYEALEEDDDL